MAPDILGDTTVCVAARSRAPFCGSKAFEPYAKVSVINEFLGGDRITTNQTNFFLTLSGPAIDVTAGLNARITDSIYLYGQYEYENADKFRAPWAVNTGLRWQW